MLSHYPVQYEQEGTTKLFLIMFHHRTLNIEVLEIWRDEGSARDWRDERSARDMEIWPVL